MRADKSKGRRAWCKNCSNPTNVKYCRSCEQHKPLAEFHVRRDSLQSLEDYDNMAKAQNGGCAVCGNTERLVVDHDHKTGKVRGLLCDLCNRGLGMFKDDPEVLHKAIEYLS